MNQFQKTALLLLCGIILILLTNWFIDTSRQSSQAKKPISRKEYWNKRTYQKPVTSVDIPMPLTSNLPIVIIDTKGRRIPDEPKIPAQMKIIYDGSGGRNSIDNPHIHFEGKIGIETRGQTSSGFPKKQYGFEFQDENGKDKDVSIFNLPAESDWVLHGPYTDKTLMRNYLAYEFSNRIDRYACRTKFVEVFLNNTGVKTIQSKHYVGIYLLIEKIKRGKSRVNIESLKPTHSKPPEISGGYIIKIDKMDDKETFFFTQRGTKLAHVYPKGHKMPYIQRDWIQNYMSIFESVLAAKNYKDPNKGYAKYIDVDSFIDHFIINELFKNIDGFRISTYMYKDRGGKLTMGPVWDFNWSAGNISFNDGRNTNSWLIYTNHVPFWWNRLLSDNSFKQKLVNKWKKLRKNELATSAILDEIDKTAEYLSEAQKRNFVRWRVLGHGNIANRDPGSTAYQVEVNTIKIWIRTRLQWMDKHIELLPQKKRDYQDN